jgi:hypothetical protein
MKFKSLASMVVAMAALIISVPLSAHHGASEYDMTKLTTVERGTISRFEFANPHVRIYWETKGEKGEVQEWTAEGTTPNILYRSGWNKDSLKPGDQLKLVAGNRCKNGSNCMRLRQIVLGNGQELPVPQ